MAYETMNPYIPANDFSDDEAAVLAGRSTVLTAGLDAELLALQDLTDAFKANIDLMVRSDGRIQDRWVELHGLHPDIFVGLAANINLLSVTGATLLPAVDTGSADAIVASMTPAPATYFNGLVVLVLMNASVTGGPVTADINGLGTTPVKQADGTTDPAAGELQAGGYAFLIHDGTSFQHINKTTSSGSISAHLADLANPHVVTSAQVGILVGDVTDTDTVRDKVFSNNDLKIPTDYVAVGHLPLVGGTISGALTLAGANTLSGLTSFTNIASMTAKQFRGAYVVAVASASTVDLGLVLGNSCIITGSVGINEFGTVQAGTWMDIEFSGAPVISDSANLILPTSGPITANIGDTCRVISRGGGVWKMYNFFRRDGTALIAPTGNVQTGVCSPFVGGTSAPSGWVSAAGSTIGNAVSGAAERANADTQTLFEMLWNNMADSQAIVSGGRGASATADFNNNKTIELPDMRGRMPAGTGGTQMTLHGDVGGEERHTLITSESPAHTHTHARLNEAATGGGNQHFTTKSGSGGTTGSSGGGGDHQNMPPFLALRYIIKL